MVFSCKGKLWATIMDCPYACTQDLFYPQIIIRILLPQVIPGVPSAPAGAIREPPPLLFFAGNQLLRLSQKGLKGLDDFRGLADLPILSQFPQLLKSGLRFLKTAEFM